MQPTLHLTMLVSRKFWEYSLNLSLAGLAGAIVKKGYLTYLSFYLIHYSGKEIQDESDLWVNKHGRVDDGFVVVTTAGKLPCKHVFHSVGPIWRGGNEGEEIILGMAVRGCLEKAQEMKLTSISLPAISSGINS